MNKNNRIIGIVFFVCVSHSAVSPIQHCIRTGLTGVQLGI